MNERHGVLPVDKPVGPTSHDAVARARKALGTRRIGHTGTLDPFASGLLLLCVGSATRLSEYLTHLPKRYVGVARLGARTDTDDHTGNPVWTSESWRVLDDETIRNAFAAQTGDIAQVPPAFSAKTGDGERLYARARRGEGVVAAPVQIHIARIDVRAIDLPEVEFEVDCSSGTYIRSIARDVGDALGVGAHLSALRRVRVGAFDVADAVPLDEITDAQRVAQAWLEPLAAVQHLPVCDVDDAAAAALRHGRAVTTAPTLAAAPTVAVSHAGHLIAMARLEDGRLRPTKVFGE